VLELVKGSSYSSVIPIFYPFIPELCSLTLETYYSGNYASILASALEAMILFTSAAIFVNVGPHCGYYE
jgi:hypothetical protein